MFRVSPVLLLLALGCGDKSTAEQPDDDTGPVGKDSGEPVTDVDGDGFDAVVHGGEDCDDDDPTVHPEADEVCNGLDDDCDALVDADDDDVVDALTWYSDADGDGYGDDLDPGMVACEAPEAMVELQGDCDDGLAHVNPDGVEVCDELDQDEDCDGLADDADDSVDPSTLRTWYVDADGDGFGDLWDPGTVACDGPSGTEVEDATDCNDADVAVYPGAREGWTDGKDEDCDGRIDETWLDVEDAAVTFGTTGTGWCCRLGWGSAIGDYTGDGIDDAAISDFSNSAAVRGGGAVYLFEGPLTGGTHIVDTDTHTLVSGQTSNQQVGFGVSLSHDVDGDGYHDIVGGDVYGLDFTGAAFVVHGPASGTIWARDADLYVQGSSVQSLLGWLVTQGVGDIDDDGVVDVLFTAPEDDVWGEDVGAAYFFAGTTTGSYAVGEAETVIHGVDASAGLGTAVQGDIDLDGDGVGDLLLGSGAMGEVYTFLGPITGTLGTDDADHTLSSAAGRFGDELAAGDFDGDGVMDLAVGAPYYSAVAPYAGRVYAFSGPISALGSEADAVFTSSGNDKDEQVGNHLSDVIFDDLDGDGFDDLFVGGRESYSGSSGADGHIGVHLGPLSGAADMEAADQNFSSTSTNGGIGNTLATGDVDGDGLLDLLSGSWKDNQSHIWLGSQL